MYKRLLAFPVWAILLATGSGLLILVMLGLNRIGLPASSQVSPATSQTEENASLPNLGPRHQLTYQQWVDLLGREAKVTAEQAPPRLTILAGDSLSLWFPQELLPGDRTWLNQGISGETSYGLLKRLRLFDATKPEAIFVMIGINDLIRGVRQETLLANQREIVRHLKNIHPQTRIILQSILPHGGGLFLEQRYRQLIEQKQQPAWVNRLLYEIPNRTIFELNEQLAKIAAEEKVTYLDLFPHFADPEGNILPELTTDGLHLSSQGYQVWRSRLEAFNQSLLQPETVSRSTPSNPP